MSDCYENCKDIRNGVCPPMKTFCPRKLTEHDKQIRADAIEEFKNALTKDLIKLQDKYFDLAKRTTMPERRTYLKRMDTVELIIEQIKLKSEQMQKGEENE